MASGRGACACVSVCTACTGVTCCCACRRTRMCHKLRASCACPPAVAQDGMAGLPLALSRARAFMHVTKTSCIQYREKFTEVVPAHEEHEPEWRPIISWLQQVGTFWCPAVPPQVVLPRWLAAVLLPFSACASS